MKNIPLVARLSLGSFVFVDHIEKARRLCLPHVYLGYWVEGLIPAAGTPRPAGLGAGGAVAADARNPSLTRPLRLLAGETIGDFGAKSSNQLDSAR
jgi:hypothetical protein